MIFKGSICAVLMATVFAMATEPVHAYYDDTHYSLTYYIARSCGFTPLQAFRIASATLAVDYSETSEPLQPMKVADLAETGQTPREEFHSFWDYRLGSTRQFARLDGAWKGRELKWMELAKAQRNPGVLLHYVQDEAPHKGYATFGGHWFPSADDAMDPPLDADEAPAEIRLPFGPKNDFLSNSQPRALRMVDKTVEMLRTFMGSMSQKQRLGVRCNRAAILPVLSRLIIANPINEPVVEYAKRVDAFMNEMKKQNVTDAQIRAIYLPLGVVFDTYQGSGPLDKLALGVAAARVAPLVAVPVLATELGRQAVGLVIPLLDAKAAVPKVELADAAVALALADQDPPYEPSNRREEYTFSKAGTNHSDLPPFAVYGTLRTNVRGAAGRAVEVSVWAAPTRTGEQPYQLDCKSGSEVTTFENLPVGDLIIQTAVDGKVTKHPKFTFAARPLQFTNVNVSPAAKKDEKQSECRKQAAEKSQAVCKSFESGPAKSLVGNSPVNFDQARSQGLEADFEKQLDDCDKEEKEEEKKRTENTEQSPPQTPPPTPTRGGGVGTVVKAGIVIVGATVGGLYLKSELDKLDELYPTTTTTTTTTTTPTSTTPTSSGTMTYVGGTFTCTFNAGGVLNLCNNSNIRVNITLRMPVGTTLRLTASGAVSSSLPQTRTDPPGEVVFQNFNGFGNFDTCPAPVRQIVLFNASTAAAIASANVSIPVSCR